MHHTLLHKRITEQAIFATVLITMLVLHGCKTEPKLQPKAPPIDPKEHQNTTQTDTLRGSCIPVEGTVLGDIKPNSIVYVYETESLNYSVVMSAARRPWPISWALVNTSNGFSFGCLTPGNYTFVIPTSAYNGSVGSPLPYEFDCGNLSLEIAFQGGDYAYSVGAFSIEKAGRNEPECGPSCRLDKGRLYKECPLSAG